MDLKSAKKGNKYRCHNCVDVNKDLADHMEFKNESLDQSKEVEELAKQLQDVSFENKETKSLNRKLHNLQKKYDQLMRQDLEARKKDKETIQKLQQDLSERNQRIKEVAASEIELKSKMNKMEEEIQERPMTKLVSTINSLFKEQGDAICKEVRKVIGDEVRESHKRAQDTIGKRITTHADATGNDEEKKIPTYASVVNDEWGSKNDDWGCPGAPWDVVPEKTTKESFKSILKEVRNDELTEEREKKRRSCNLIIHGSTECKDSNAAMKDDKDLVQYLMSTIGVAESVKSVTRLGEKREGRRRPIKVALNNEEDKTKILSRLWKLRGVARFDRISVSEDFTIAERETLKIWQEKAKGKNEEEPADSNVIWRVRGSPKNGLFLKRIARRPHPSNPVL